MIKNFIKKLGNKGSVLSTSIVVMVVLASSVAAITSIAIQTNKTANLKNEFLTDETTGMKLIEQSISEFEYFITNSTSDTEETIFEIYERTVIPVVQSQYGVTVENVTSQYTEEGYTNDINSTYKAYVYRFSYQLESGNTLQMFSYVSSEGSTVNNAGDPITPFSFSMGTNGDLILSGGYFDNPTELSDNPSYFGNRIFLNYRSPYKIEDRWGSDWYVTNSSSGSYPEFNDPANVDVYYISSYEFCEANCWITPNSGDDPIKINTAEGVYTDISEAEFDAGNYNQNQVVPNFFGTYDFDEELRQFLIEDAPTDDRQMVGTYDLNASLDEIKDLVRANTGEVTEVCEWVLVEGKHWWQDKWVEQCYYAAADAPFTDITDLDGYNVQSGDQTLPVSAVYDGDLVLSKGIHNEDRDNEAIVVLGDLIFDNSSWITVDGKFVVLGDLIFQGDIVDIDGAFYVYGQTIMNFDSNSGINEAGDTSEYGFTLISKDNIIVNSMWEGNNWSGNGWGEFDAFFYTEESIYIDAIFSRVHMKGVLFANALGESGNHIPVTDENGNYINGIYISSYRGWINNRGNLRPSTDTYDNRFYYMGVNDQEYQDAFVEIPEFDSVIFKEGGYTFERSEFSYIEQSN